MRYSLDLDDEQPVWMGEHEIFDADDFFRVKSAESEYGTIGVGNFTCKLFVPFVNGKLYTVSILKNERYGIIDGCCTAVLCPAVDRIYRCAGEARRVAALSSSKWGNRYAE